MGDEWDELDGAAKANLGAAGFQRFLQYKADLRKDGHAWLGDACDILTGYIWDESEESCEDA